MSEQIKRNEGFSLVELLIALFISSVMAAAIFNLFIAQNKSFSVQDQVTEMQQNIRAALNTMVKEIRMAGYDPTGKAGAGIITANPDQIVFTMDLNSDSNCNDFNEYITYSLYESGDGIRKLGRRGKKREHNAPVIEYVEALGFAYAFDGNSDGFSDTDGPYIIWAIDKGGIWYDLDTNDDGKIDFGDNVVNGEKTGISARLEDIRAVRIWLLIRSRKSEDGYNNTKTYVVGSRLIRPDSDKDSKNDHTRMRLVETIVRLRNMH
ncbi:MAG: PilW family protein [bacterium]